ncbi:MAG: MMPL family transporter, partial [Bacteroidia bacterium]|nr:MMPL family transporter [Bacteroidia bacterium]
MFLQLAKIILRNRLALLLIIGGLTAVFGYYAVNVQLSYDFPRILPTSDPDYKAHQEFKSLFGEDGTVMVIGIKDQSLFELEKFNAWYVLGNKVKAIEGIQEVVSVAHLYKLQKNDKENKFELKPIIESPVESQKELDDIKKEIFNLPFYEDFIYNEKTGASLMAITFDKEKVNSEGRISIVRQIEKEAKKFEKTFGQEISMSGMPYIRTTITAKVARELVLFLILAFLVSAVILFLFFRSFKIVLFSVMVVAIGVIWSVGCISIFGFRITMLTSLIPTLIIVIGIPNCILLLNKYHTEFTKHGSKIRSLAAVVQNIGFTTFLANTTSAIGFGVFYFTNSSILMEFGLVAAVNIMATYLISLILIPIVFSYLKPPKVKHVKHIKNKNLTKLLESVDYLVHNKSNVIYATVVGIMIVSFLGLLKIDTVGYIVDDLPKDDKLYTDLKFFEEHFNGVLPLEIWIESKDDRKMTTYSNLRKLNKLQKELTDYPELSKSLSIVDGVKFSYQAYKNGNPKAFILPSSMKLAELRRYVNDEQDDQGTFKSFIDSSKTKTRVSVQMADIGSKRMKVLIDDLSPKIDSIFDKEEYNAYITGNSRIFLKGNNYLLSNLMESIILAIVLISFIMIMLFMSVRMIAISILPSLIPLLITAGLMGYFNIPLKPSTILIFSIAFGISSDGTIYFLTKYRQEMRYNPSISISRAVSNTIRETGLSMVYT